MRKDPPADAPYLYATMMLSLADRRRTFVLNDPAGLREANEKLYALNFPGAIPPTIVTYEIPRLKKFMEEQGGEMIVKPLDGHGGEGVFHAHARDRNLNAILEVGDALREPSDHGPTLYPGNSQRRQTTDRAQRRAARVVPCACRATTSNRGNIHVGGNCVKAEITPRDREICRMMRPRLERDGLYFVGLDIIGDFMTEVNVTSPTGIQEIDQLDGVNLEAKVIDFVESRVAALRA